MNVAQLPTLVPADDLSIEQFEDPQVKLGRIVRIAKIVVGVLVFGLFGLAAIVQITGAVVAFGEVGVESKVKRIAHPTGGVIAEIHVKDGDRVKAGQPLLRLDSTVTGVSADVSGEGLDQLEARQARLRAERDGTALVFPPALLSRTDPSAQAAVASETRLYNLRRQAISGQQAQLAERVRQTNAQIAGYQSQVSASRRQAKLIEPERAGVRELWDKNLVTINRLNQLERTAVELEANTASLESSIAQARARITEIRQQSIQLDQDARSEAGKELAEVTARLAEQEVRKVSAGDLNRRTVIRAPYNGIVDKLAYNTIGGVIPPAETIVEIVPDTDQFTVEAKVSPADVDQLQPGQAATLRFSAFNLQTTPEIMGTLRHVSAERVVDERSGGSYYNVRIEVDESEYRKLGSVKLVPGMPVEAFIQTGSRSLLSYITKPLRDQLSRAFREN